MREWWLIEWAQSPGSFGRKVPSWVIVLSTLTLHLTKGESAPTQLSVLRDQNTTPALTGEAWCQFVQTMKRANHDLP